MAPPQLKVLCFVLVFLLGCAGAREDDDEDLGRKGRGLSLFQIVRFPNDPCAGGSNLNGTCYTAAECSSRGGTNGGSCASGYGVCCTFTANCGATSSENCTYFQSTGAEIGQCQITICRCNTNVCQLRLDFQTFQITGPSTSTTTVAALLNGLPTGVTAAGALATTASQCLTDTFSVSSPSGEGPPTICGTNTGEHMYVDSSSACNTLSFQLGQQGLGANIGTRTWNIKITQYSCDHPNLAPEGCTQYYFGQTSATVQTFNFAGGQHLADQDQNICIRRERGNCRICWTAMASADFMVSSGIASMGVAMTQTKCCRYGSAGTATIGGDCAIIPGAFKAMTTTVMGFTRYCGRSKGLVTSAAGTMPKTICSLRTPFNIRFLSDTFEFMAEAAIANAGFRLTYIQNANNC